MCIAGQASWSGIVARGRVSGVYSRSMAVRSSRSGMRESNILFIATRSRVSGTYKKKITTRGRFGGRATINIVSGMYARSSSPCRRLGQCVWYACEQYLGVSPPGAVRSVSLPGEEYSVWYAHSITVRGTAQYVSYAREQDHHLESCPEAA